jgi:hypothetical protein
MLPLAAIYLLIGFFLDVAAFRLLIHLGLHWAVSLALAALPPVATFFFGLFGLLGSALFVGALYKAAS